MKYIWGTLTYSSIFSSVMIYALNKKLFRGACNCPVVCWMQPQRSDRAHRKLVCVCVRQIAKQTAGAGERVCVWWESEKSEQRKCMPIHLLDRSGQVQRYGSLTRSIFYFGLCALIKLHAKCPGRAHTERYKPYNPSPPPPQLCKPNNL